MKKKNLEVVLKITERCNINCDYCYMFNLGNEDYKERSPYISMDTVEAVSEFIWKGANEVGAEKVTIILHGGEPLMMKKARFDELCHALRRGATDKCSIQLGLQTNAMLVDYDWIRIFARHRIGVGVSLDGDEWANDRHRVDHQGRGTYQESIRGLALLQRAADTDIIPEPGILSVIDPSQDPHHLYEHLVHKLGVKNLNFLLPVVSHDTFDVSLLASYESFMTGLAEAWFADNPNVVDLRLTRQFVNFLLFPSSRSMISEPDHALLTISSDGDLGADDDLKPVNIGQNIGNVRDMSLKDFLDHEDIKYIDEVSRALPSACQQCAWQNYCAGGAIHGTLVNRFRTGHLFDSASVLCLPLKGFYLSIVARLIAQGHRVEAFESALDFDGEARQLVTDVSVPESINIRRKPYRTIAISHEH